MHSVYLIRHGKSSLEGSEDERGLTPEGEVHARQICEHLIKINPSIKALYASPYRRAGLTMEPLAEALNLSISVVHDFHEKIMSTEPVLSLKEARIEMWKDFDFRLPGGETSHEAQQRGIKALESLREAHPDEAVAVGSHGTLIGLMINAYDPTFGYENWRGMPMPDIFRFDFPEASTPIIEHIGCGDIETFAVKG